MREASDIDKDYSSFLLDRANRTYLAMASIEDGMAIEEFAVERPEAPARVQVSPRSRCRTALDHAGPPRHGVGAA